MQASTSDFHQFARVRESGSGPFERVVREWYCRQARFHGDPTEAPIYGDMSPWLDTLLTKVETILPAAEYLFIDNHGDRITDLGEAWNNACQLAGIPTLLFRDLRRTAARNMFRCGFTEATITRVAGLKALDLLWHCTTMDKEGRSCSGTALAAIFRWATGIKPSEVNRCQSKLTRCLK